MVEFEWAACTDPGPMLGLLQRSGRADERKSRLFACACVRRVWSLLPGSACEGVVEVAERFADGTANVEELASALAALDFTRRLRGAAGAARTACWLAAFDSTAASRLNPAYGGGGPFELARVSLAAGHAREAAVRQAAAEAQRAARPARHAMRAAKETEIRAQADLLRDLVGPDPFHTPAIDPAWRPPAVVALAQAAYEERQLPDGLLDPARLGVLADALEEAGCDDEHLLAHLRGPGPHPRGCFALDAARGSKTSSPGSR
jgi:hypothetical protein